MAHGADAVMFFQMKRSIGACEKHHGAVIDHVGNGNTRVYHEVEQFGEELAALGAQTLGGRTPAGIGMIFDWDNWWALTHSAGPSCDLDYIKEWKKYYRALREMNYDVDIVSSKDDFSKYKVLLAPVWYMVKEDDDESVRRYVKEGGTFVTGFFSGIVQENDLVVTGGYPGKLRDILGIWVEESDALPNGVENSFFYRDVRYPACILCDLIHLEGAEQIDESGYEADFYKGFPLLTRNSFGEGRAYYVAASSSSKFYHAFLNDICHEAGISPVMETPEGVEAACRECEKGTYVYIMNHTNEEKSVHLPWKGRSVLGEDKIVEGDVLLPQYGVLILKKETFPILS